MPMSSSVSLSLSASPSLPPSLPPSCPLHPLPSVSLPVRLDHMTSTHLGVVINPESDKRGIGSREHHGVAQAVDTIRTLLTHDKLMIHHQWRKRPHCDDVHVHVDPPKIAQRLQPKQIRHMCHVQDGPSVDRHHGVHLCRTQTGRRV